MPGLLDSVVWTAQTLDFCPFLPLTWSEAGRQVAQGAAIGCLQPDQYLGTRSVIGQPPGTVICLSFCGRGLLQPGPSAAVAFCGRGLLRPWPSAAVDTAQMQPQLYPSPFSAPSTAFPHHTGAQAWSKHTTALSSRSCEKRAQQRASTMGFSRCGSSGAAHPRPRLVRAGVPAERHEPPRERAVRR